MALLGEDGGDALSPCAFHRIEQLQLVVDHHVVPGGIGALHGVQLLLLVNAVEYVAAECAPDAGAHQLVRLKDAVAIGENHRKPPLPHMRDGGQRIGVEALGKRIVQEPGGQAQGADIVQVLQPEALQCAEEIDITMFAALLLENGPEAVVRLLAERALYPPAEIVLDAVIVEQSIVDVEQEDDVSCLGHRPAYAGWGLSQGPSAPMSFVASSGPQVPGL